MQSTSSLSQGYFDSFTPTPGQSHLPEAIGDTQESFRLVQYQLSNLQIPNLIDIGIIINSNWNFGYLFGLSLHQLAR